MPLRGSSARNPTLFDEQLYCRVSTLVRGSYAGSHSGPLGPHGYSCGNCQCYIQSRGRQHGQYRLPSDQLKLDLELQLGPAFHLFPLSSVDLKPRPFTAGFCIWSPEVEAQTRPCKSTGMECDTYHALPRASIYPDNALILRLAIFPEHLPQPVRDLADRGVRIRRFDNRRHQVRSLAGRRLQNIQPLADRRGASRRPHLS